MYYRFFRFSKFSSLLFCTIFLLNLSYPTLAQESATGSEGGGNAQSPIQVVVQIVVTAVVLKILSSFRLP